ncbi:hypothetical protein YC2023_112617 [Brassica napus]
MPTANRWKVEPLRTRVNALKQMLNLHHHMFATECILLSNNPRPKLASLKLKNQEIKVD